jgi:SAM-dependent methyltransferase
LVQRAGKVPIVVARLAARGEMPNDHQLEFLLNEEKHGAVVPIWDLECLPEVVAAHPQRERSLIKARPPTPAADSEQVASILDREWKSIVDNPFRRHPLRRYAFAWDELHDRTGCHLDIGCNTGDFLGVLAATTSLECYGVDPHPDYVRQAAHRYPQLSVRHITPTQQLPYLDGYFSSVSVLDVLEHCPSEDALLSEMRRVLQPEGIAVLSVPARHIFTWMDPDNLKYRMPGLHRLLYSLRFGRDVYRKRFQNCSNGLFGEMSVGKREHTNYRPEWLLERLRAHGFQCVRQTGANLFWRWFHVPALVLGPRLRRPFERAIWLDGELFHTANLFLTARKLN